MHEHRSIAYNVLPIIVTTVTLIHELVLFTSPWIYSPSPFPTPTQAVSFPHPAFTAVSYTIAEPLYMTLFTKIGIAPWIFVLASPQHLLLCELSMEYLRHLLVVKLREAQSLQSPGPSETHQVGTKPGNLASEHRPKLHERQLNWGAYVAALLPVQSAAASNAALLLFVADLDASLKGDKADLLLIFGYLAILFYLGSRYADVIICQCTYKTPIYSRQPLSSLKLQLYYLALLLALKIGVRQLLGLHAFPLLQAADSHEVQHPLGQEMPPWVGTLDPWVPAWLPMVMPVVTVPLSIYGARLFRRSLEG